MLRHMSTRRARQLRQSMTPEEIILWSGLKQLRAMGFQFRRQALFRTTTWISSASSGGWLSRPHHRADDRQAEHDMVRDGILGRQGFKVMRYANVRIRRQLNEIVGEVLEALKAWQAVWGSEIGQAGASPLGVEGRIVDAPP
jgi:very-short-patch-repair endonuclease